MFKTVPIPARRTSSLDWDRLAAELKRLPDGEAKRIPVPNGRLARSFRNSAVINLRGRGLVVSASFHDSGRFVTIWERRPNEERCSGIPST